MATATQTPPEADNDASNGDKLNPGQRRFDREFNGIIDPANYSQDGKEGDLSGGPKESDEKKGFWNGQDADAAHDSSGQTPQSLNDAEANPMGAGSLFHPEKGGRGGGDWRKRLGAMVGTMLGPQNRAKTILGTGGITTIIIGAILGSTGMASLEIIHIREDMMSNGTNGIMSRVMKHRFNKSMGKIFRSLANPSEQDKLLKSLDKTSMQEKFTEAGFDMKFDSEGKLSKLSYQGHEMDLSGNKDAFDKWVGSDPSGELQAKLYEAGGFKSSMWKGVGASYLWKELGVSFRNWLDPTKAKNTDKNGKPLTDAEKLAERLRPEEIGNESVSGDAVVSTKDTAAAAKDAQGTNPNPPDNLSEKLGETLDVSGVPKLQSDMVNDPTNPGPSSDIPGLATSDSLITTLENSPGELANAVGPVTETAVKKGLNILGINQIACSVVGRVKFVTAIQNVVLTYALARFAVSYLVAADNQKAGVVSSQGIKLLALYLNTRSPTTGRTAVNSGGLRSIFGDKTATANSVDLGKFSTSRTPSGFLGVLYKIARSVPGTSSGQCKFVNNAFVSLGGLVVGGVLAFFSGGTSVEAYIGETLQMAIAYQLAINLGTALLLKGAVGMVMTGLENNGELVGDALAAGSGSLGNLLGQANGLRPATTTQVGLLTQEVNKDQQYATAHESLFDRYLSLGNTNSLASDIALQFAPQLTSPGSTVSSIVTGIPNMFGSLFSSLNPFSAKVAAATDPSAHCQDDPLIKKYNLATDQFCNIVMANAPELDQDQTQSILLANQQVDQDGQVVPGSYYDQWIKDCASGRSSLGYTDPTQDASALKNGDAGVFDQLSINGKDYNPCIEDGPAFPGDNVGMFNRFSAQYGYKIDEASFVSWANGDYNNDGLTNDPSSSASTPSTSTSSSTSSSGSTSTSSGGNNCSFDTSQAPDLASAATQYKTVCENAFPQIEQLLNLVPLTSSPHTYIFKNNSVPGETFPDGHVELGISWFRQHTDPGAVVHETVHVVQAYAGNTPSWFTEGVADWGRFKLGYATSWSYPHCTSTTNYLSGYNCSAAFLNYVQNHYRSSIVQDISQKARLGQYSDNLFQQYTGKSVQTLYQECLQADCKGGK